MKHHVYQKHPIAFWGLLFLFLLLSLTGIGQPFHFTSTYKGANEVPANNSTATGTITGTYDSVTNVISFTISFTGLSANTTGAHFHGPAVPGSNAPVVFPHDSVPLGVTAATTGTATDTLSQAQEADLLAGKWYSNIHTSNFPGGEIRALIFFTDAAFVKPVITCPKDTVVNNAAGVCSQLVSFAATATGTPAPSFTYKIGPTVISLPYNFPGGTTTVKAIALNGGGFDTCHFTVTVKDTTKPVIQCPANITVFNDPGICGAKVNYTVTATDNCSGVLVTTLPASGTVLPVGTSTVTATATDAAGNTSTCSFSVTVKDNEPPVISDLKASPGKLWPPNHKMQNVTVDYTSKDNCGIVSCEMKVTSNQPDNGTGDGNTTGDWKVIDDHHIMLRAERAGNGGDRIYTIWVTCTDQYGNSASKSTTVVVPHDMAHVMRPAKIMGHIYPNPGNNLFTLNIETLSNNERIEVKVVDQSGRVLETRNNLYGNQGIRLGSQLKPGVYMVVLNQGTETAQLKWFKIR